MLILDIWHTVFQVSENLELNILMRCSNYFNKEIVQIFKKRRLNYPRTSGKYVLHTVPFISVDEKDILKYVYNKGYDMVKGDVIRFEGHEGLRYRYIYDGEKLTKYFQSWYTPIYMNAIDVVKDNVPFEYWNVFKEYFTDLKPHLIECFNNIGYDLLHNIVDDCHEDYTDDYVLYTKFKHYTIVLHNGEIQNKYLEGGKIKSSSMPKVIKKFKRALEASPFCFDVHNVFGKNTLLTYIL